MKLPTLRLIPLLLACATGLSAQERARWGVEIGLPLPMADVRRLGFDSGLLFGVTTQIQLTPRQFIRPALRLEGWIHGYGSGSPGDRSGGVYQAGADYLISFSGSRQSSYFLAGAAYQVTKLRDRDDSPPAQDFGAWRPFGTGRALAWSVGFGSGLHYDVGLEARFTASRPEIAGTRVSVRAVELVLILRSWN